MDPAQRHQQQQDQHDVDVVTWREFTSELKSFRSETRLLIVVGFAAIKFQIPDAITAGSLLSVFAWGALKSFLAR